LAFVIASPECHQRVASNDPDTADQDPDVLRDIVRRFSGRLCLNAAVTRAGRVEEGQPVELVATDAHHEVDY